MKTMKIIKKFLTLYILIITNIKYSFAVWDETIKSWLLSNPETDTIIIDGNDWLNTLDTIFNYFQDSISWLIMLIAIWVFLYIWIKLVIARWNPEDFKKAMMQFVYAAIWLFVVSASWAIVKLVAWLNIW